MKTKPSTFRLAAQSVAIIAVGLLVPWRGSAAEPVPGANATVSASANLPYSASEVVKLYQGGINKDVILNYIHSSAAPFQLSADGIIYLQSLGLPQEYTKAMIERDGELAGPQGAQIPQTPPPWQMTPPYTASQQAPQAAPAQPSAEYPYDNNA